MRPIRYTCRIAAPAAGEAIPGGRWKEKHMVKCPLPHPSWNRFRQIILLLALVTDEAAKVISVLHGR